jgi:SAM-dependent methyltransferase
VDDPDEGFPPGFFAREDESPDPTFYAPARLVTHIDDRAILAVGQVYEQLGVAGRVLDLMSSWVSHFVTRPDELTVLGMNETELDNNPMAHHRVVHDLNADPHLPLPDSRYDAVVCCVSVDYLTRPIEVFREVRRVLAPGGPFVCTFSNRVFPTKAIRGWLYASESDRLGIVAEYFRRSGGWRSLHAQQFLDDAMGDPLWGVWASKAPIDTQAS